MLAYRLLQAQTQPEFQDVPEPHAGPGQVIVRVAGSCGAASIGSRSRMRAVLMPVPLQARAAGEGATDSSRVAPATAGA
jgi:hypothetical protein